MNKTSHNSLNEKITLAIEGMHCAGCVQSVEKSLKSTQGVLSVSVNFATEKAHVEFDPGTAQVSDLVQAVKTAGYDIKQETKKVTLKIGGMHCAACVGNVERALLETDGVLVAKVNLATENATIKFDANITNINTLREAIKNSGYQFLGEAPVQEVSTVSDGDQKKVQEARSRMVISWAFTIDRGRKFLRMAGSWMAKAL